MNWSYLPQLIEWIQKHIILSIVSLLVIIVLFTGYSFIGGYANALGISVGTEYSYFKRSVASYTVIDTMLQHYQVKFTASRVGIARFHDNVRDVANNSMFFVSYQSIIAAPGITANMDDVKNLPASSFSPMLPKLLDNQSVLVMTKDLPNGALKELLAKRGDLATLYAPIYDLRERLVGFIAISWMYEGEIPKNITDPVLLKEISIVADRIGAYFSARE